LAHEEQMHAENAALSNELRPHPRGSEGTESDGEWNAREQQHQAKRVLVPGMKN
jgi:hypothetical protein